jgi:feruloyl-CoA synthase
MSGSVIRDPARLFAAPATRLTARADGSLLLASPWALGPFPRCLGEHLERWAREAPERPFLLERGGDNAWRGVGYAEALREVRRVAGWLLGNGAAPERPVAILSDNGVEHGLLTLAAMHAGVPAMPVSAAYSLQSRDHAKLRSIIERTSPAVIFVDDYARYAAALAAIRPLHEARLVIGSTSAPADVPAARFDELRPAVSEDRLAAAYAAIGPDTLAKILFTSGSTDEPKGVLNTQRMLCSNQQARAQVWPFLDGSPPVIVDWLPWSHTFGGNHNFNFVLRNGGTLYVDGGRPVPALFPQTIANLRAVAPTVYFNVPRGYELLLPALQEDAGLRRSFFSRLQLIFYAAASLPQHIWDGLRQLSAEVTGEAVPLVSAWGSTETAPLVTDCHFQATQPGVIGVPVPGCELKLVPGAGKLEVRVRGPNVTPGYWRRPDLTARAFDADGFYAIGDAVRFVDSDRPEHGLLFDGRVAEDFKLTSGTWVHVGALRLRAIAALAPLAQDIVVAGHDRDEVCFLIFPNLPACRALCEGLGAEAPAEDVLAQPAVRARLAAGLAELRRQTPASSMHAARALLLATPPSIDAGEITDKGYINQRAVLTHRRQSVEALYAPGSPGSIAPL